MIDLVIIDLQTCGIIMSDYEFCYNIKCSIEQVLSGSDLSIGSQVHGDNDIFFIAGESKILITYHTLVLSIASLQVLGNIRTVLTAQDHDIGAGNGAVHSTVSFVIAVNDEHTAGTCIDIAGKDLTVQIQNSSSIQCQSSGCSDICQQDNGAAIRQVCQSLSILRSQICSCQHTDRILQICSLQSSSIDAHCNILLVQVQ